MLKKIDKKKVKIIFKNNSYIVLIKFKVFLILPIEISPIKNISRRTYTYLILLKILRNFGMVKTVNFEHDSV